MFKRWFEDCGEVANTYSNVEDENFARKGVNSKYTGGRQSPRSTKNPDRLFKFKNKERHGRT